MMSDETMFPRSGNTSDEALARAAARASAGEANKHPDRAGKKMTDRRTRRRALISAPVRVRGVDSTANGPDEISTTVDVSRNGFLFVSSRNDFVRGLVVAVTFPYSKSPMASQAEQPGRVVRVSQLADGRTAVAIALGTGTSEVLVDASGSALVSDSEIVAGQLPSSDAKPLVVVVDADATVRESLESLLTAQGYEVAALQNARQAHALLDRTLPALLIAEIEGDDLPGYDLCARIKSTERLHGIPVVLTTYFANPSDYANAHSLGAVVCMAKPFRMDRLGHIVRLLAPVEGPRRETDSFRPADRERRSWTDRRKNGDRSFRLGL